MLIIQKKKPPTFLKKTSYIPPKAGEFVCSRCQWGFLGTPVNGMCTPCSKLPPEEVSTDQTYRVLILLIK